MYNEKIEGSRKKFKQDELNKNFSNIYKINDPRCLYCKYNIIPLFHDHPILTSEGNPRKVYHSDHMISLANNGNDSVKNLMPICNMCNTAKSRSDFLEFLIRIVATIKDNRRNNEQIPNVLYTLDEAKKYYINNKNKIYYSDFITYEMTQFSKKYFLENIYKYFKKNYDFEPYNDIIFDYNRNEYFLSPISKNIEYLYHFWHGKPEDYLFIIINVLLKKNEELLRPSDNHEELIGYLSNYNFNNLNYSDFIVYSMTFQEKIDIIKNIINFFRNNFKNEPHFDICYDGNDIILASNSLNRNYYYKGKLDGTYEWIPNDIEFLFMIVTMRKKNCFDPPIRNNDLYFGINNTNYCYSDFINEEMNNNVKTDILNFTKSFAKKNNIYIHDDIYINDNGDIIPNEKNNFYKNKEMTINFLFN
jgi:hypothetical protein